MSSPPVSRITSATAIDRTLKPRRPLRVTIIAANPFQFDSRFLRTAESLAEDGHAVTVAAWSGYGLPSDEQLAPAVRLLRLDVSRPISDALKPLPRSLRRVVSRLLGLDPDIATLPPTTPRRFDRLRHPIRRSLEIVAIARRVGPWTDAIVSAVAETDVFHCQSFVALPVAHDAARRSGARFVYDVADYHSEAERVARMPRLVRAIVRRREQAWVRDAAGFLAVSDPVADLVATRWHIERPAVLLNCPPAWRPSELGPPHSDRLRDALALEPNRPIVLFQGGFSIDRGLEELVSAVNDPLIRALNVALVFMGYGRLQAYLENAARAWPGRLHVLPAVPVAELLDWTASADVSFVGQPPRTLNHRLNLPNKLFESLMAGVPVVVAEGNEQCRLVTAEHVGSCANIDDPHAIVLALAGLIDRPADERLALRHHCRTVALTRYTWERNAGGLVDLYRRLADEVP